MEYAEIQKALERIGLSSNESKIYFVLLKHGSSKAGKISKESRMNRTTTYDVLRKLLEKGLISYVVKENRKWFEAVNPRRLIEFIKEKQEEAEKILPELQKYYKKPVEKHNVTLFYSYKGIKSVFQDIIREGKPNWVMDSEGQFMERMPYYAPYFVKQLEEKDIKVRHLIREGRDVSPSKTTEVRYIKKETKSEAVINIYSNKIAIIIWTEPPEAVIIENKAVADSFKDYFEKLWQISKKQ